jgi:DNA-binding transcriptional regulator YiaG
MKAKYKSEALQVIHEDMKGMYQLGIISETRMKEFDEMCLVQEPETAYETANPEETEHTNLATA